MKPEYRILFAMVSPSTADSVAYLKSPLLVSAARHAEKHGRYLALVSVEAHEPEMPAAVYPVLAVNGTEALPRLFIPVASPCGPRAIIEPRFPWRHGPCVVDTSKAFIIQPVFESPFAQAESRNFLDSTNADPALAYLDEDMYVFRDIDQEDRRAGIVREMEEAGIDTALAEAQYAYWTDFNTYNSTKACPAPGEWSAPAWIHAKVSFDVESVLELPPSTRLHEEVKDVERWVSLSTSLQSTQYLQRTSPSFPTKHNGGHVLENGAGSLCGTPDNPRGEEVKDLENAVLVDLCAALVDDDLDPVEETPMELDPDGFPLYPEGDDLDFAEMSGLPFTSKGFDRLPPVSPPDIQIVYFDLYGTLIDNETGIYNALAPSLELSIHSLDRSQALSLYFDVEDNLKQRCPGSIYSEILARSYGEFCLRLGLDSDPVGTANFVASFFDWPLFPDAIEAMSRLRPGLLVLAGVVDVDIRTLCKCKSFQALQPYFTELFTWDAVRCYRPSQHFYDMIFRYHDKSRIPRACWTMISSSLFRDIESTRPFDVSGMWVKRPETLARNFQEPDDGIPYAWAVCDDVLDAASFLLRNRQYAHSSKWLIAS
ncbi:unnamed protein product [Mycena citricolor]|uniref:Uncharacterized protein n=1 Tax=Mycena citricolor TaxID=2018698 RepID=A0AAD2Q3X9_9AGAR|nr:unnamed protein product [Mycena citricolor]